MKDKTKKQFTTAPLPFMGQKRNFIRHFKEALKKYPSDAVYIDLFGGSGLLSHTVKSIYPEARVIYNDFDDYSKRIDNISHTNALIDDLRLILSDVPKDGRVTGKKRNEVINRLKIEANTGYVDFITISSSLLFSMNYSLDLQGFEKSSIYNCVRKNPYDATGYLDGLEIVKKDYKELFAEYSKHPGVVFLVDPPYLSTEVGTYKTYWKLTDYLDVLNVLPESSYFYFTSNKSSIVELCEWMGQKVSYVNPFHQSKKVEINARASYNSGYTDIMLYKGWTSNKTY